MSDGEYVKTVEIIECRDCGTQWFGGEEKISLDPDEEISVFFRKVYKNRCKWCRNDARGRGIPDGRNG